VALSEQPTASKITLELMTGNVVICSYVRCIKQGRRPPVLLGINWYHRMYDAISEVSYTLRSLESSPTVFTCMREMMEGMKGRQSQKLHLVMKESKSNINTINSSMAKTLRNKGCRWGANSVQWGNLIWQSEL